MLLFSRAKWVILNMTACCITGWTRRPAASCGEHQTAFIWTRRTRRTSSLPYIYVPCGGRPLTRLKQKKVYFTEKTRRIRCPSCIRNLRPLIFTGSISQRSRSASEVRMKPGCGWFCRMKASACEVLQRMRKHSVYCFRTMGHSSGSGKERTHMPGSGSLSRNSICLPGMI